MGASSFKDQNRGVVGAGQEPASDQKMSSMIPLDAPKSGTTGGSSSLEVTLHDRYRQMLMAKLDQRTLQKRKFYNNQ